MKKFNFVFSIVAIFAIVGYVSFGCKNKDKFAPKIYLNDGDAVTTELNKPFIDPGAIAEDNLDGTISGNIVVGHNIPKKYESPDSVTSKTGEYIMTYSVTDKAGNTKSASRNVKVRNYAWPYELQYLLSRKKITNNSDSVGCQYAKYYYRKLPQKTTIVADKAMNRWISLPLGGEIKIKAMGYFVDNTHIRIEQQDLIGQRGYVKTVDTNYVDTARVKYRIKGLGTDNAPMSIVSDTTNGRKKIIVKYYISKFLTLTSPDPGTNFEYTDTLTQIW